MARAFYNSNRKVTKEEVGNGVDCCCDMPDHVGLGGMWKILSFWARKVVEYYKRRHPSRSLEGSNARNYADYGSLHSKGFKREQN